MRAVLIPVKSLERAKLRLATHLDDQQRRFVARSLASMVLDSARSLPVFVACDDREIADWAIDMGAYVFWTPGLGLSGAVNASIDRLALRGFQLVTVVHADLPLVHEIEIFGEPGTVTLAPDRRNDGTNLACVPTSIGFQFSYGANSFSRHRAEAERLNLPCIVRDDWQLALDIDEPEDLAHLQQLRADHNIGDIDDGRLHWLDSIYTGIASDAHAKCDLIQ
jgi:2-phospho-L-lactate guanylyltransferase